MKFLVLWLLLVSSAFAADVSSCFKVDAQIRADEDHYWSVWSNSCEFEVPAVYVMVDFFDGKKQIGKGVWPLYYPKGQHRTNRWTAPVRLPENVTIRVHEITTDADKALHY